MLYSRLRLLWLVHMLTQTATALCENNGTECLVLKPEDSHEICSEQMDWRKVGLRHCGRSLASILPGKPSPTRDCHENIKELYARDRQAHEFVTSFQQLLRRYDCSKPYSVKFKCPDCQVNLTYISIPYTQNENDFNEFSSNNHQMSYI
jgi:hypothetical protein